MIMAEKQSISTPTSKVAATPSNYNSIDTPNPLLTSDLDHENSKDHVIKGKRRSKKDKTARNFVCGCGKQYLSYPALYTHLKTKHNGVHPPGTKCQLALKNTKRGRPKKIDIRALNEDGTVPLNEVLNTYSDTFLAPFINDSSISHKMVMEKSDIVSLRSYSCNGKTDPTIGFPVIYLCNEHKPMIHPLLLIINHYSHLKGNKQATLVLKTKNPSCDAIISLFLYCASKFFNERFYIVIGILFRNLRECLNQYGYDMIIDYLQKNSQEKIDELLQRRNEGQVFSEVENCEYIPLISEKFIHEYLPSNCPNFELALAVDCMYDFSKWLLKKKFTRVKVRYEDESAYITSKIEALKNL